MADPISVFPVFVRNQSWPVTGGGAGGTAISIEVEVEDSPLAVSVDEGALNVTISFPVIVVVGEG